MAETITDTTTAAQEIDVESLSCRATSLEPKDFDFGEGYGTTWETVYPDFSDSDFETIKGWLDDQGHNGPDGDDTDDEVAKLWREKLVEEIGDDDTDLLKRAAALLKVEVPPDPTEAGSEDDLDWPAWGREVADAIEEKLDGSNIDGLKHIARTLELDGPDFEDSDLIEKWADHANEKTQESDDFSPMMNYYYELPGLRMSAGEAQLKLLDVPLTIVTVNDETVMALTGGGMDLSWEICRAYITLGYLPPIHFYDLPRYGDDAKADVTVLRAMLRTAEVEDRRAGYASERIRERLAKAGRPAPPTPLEAAQKDLAQLLEELDHDEAGDDAAAGSYYLMGNCTADLVNRLRKFAGLDELPALAKEDK